MIEHVTPLNDKSSTIISIKYQHIRAYVNRLSKCNNLITLRVYHLFQLILFTIFHLMETLSASHHDVFNITQAYIGYLYLFLENLVIFTKIIVTSSILYTYIDHWIVYIQILYYFKYLHIFIRKNHILDT